MVNLDEIEFPYIIFFKEGHTYWKQGKKKIESVNGLLKYITPPFDHTYWSTHSVLKETFGEIYSKHFGSFRSPRPDAEELFGVFMDQMEGWEFIGKKRVMSDKWELKKIISQWRGTMFHDYMEQQAYKEGKLWNHSRQKYFPVIKKEKTFDNESLCKDLYELKDGAYLELLVFDPQYDLCGQADKVFIETIKKKRYIDIGDYKGLAIDTPILTTEGWKTMLDIKVDDHIFDGTGNPTRVRVTSQLHYKPCFKLKFDTNDFLVADHEHKWVVSVNKKRGAKARYYYEDIEMTTDQIVDYYKKREKEGKTRFGGYKMKKLAIRCTKPLKIKKSKLPIDPYILGLWLADGNNTDGTITCENTEIWGEIKKRGYKISTDHNRNSNRTESRTIYGIATHLRKMKLLFNKHIPEQYMMSSYEDRLSLLRGLMDGDGYFNPIRKRCVMQTTKEWQANLTSQLASSLGMKPTTIPYTAKGFGKSVLAFSVNFTSKANPFLIRNKNYTSFFSEKHNRRPAEYRYIESIEEVPIVPTKCLAVESETHTYLAGKNLIMTHNTNEEQPDDKSRERYLEPLDHLPKSKHMSYVLQINLYAKLLQRHGFIPRHLSYSWYENYDPDKEHHSDFPYMQGEMDTLYDFFL